MLGKFGAPFPQLFSRPLLNWNKIEGSCKNCSDASHPARNSLQPPKDVRNKSKREFSIINFLSSYLLF